MNKKIIGNERKMNYEYYIKQPMQMVELKLNVTISKNPQVINSLERNFNHHLIRKHSHILFID